jgi:tetratricopeptide (TPR) repeat protein
MAQGPVKIGAVPAAPTPAVTVAPAKPAPIVPKKYFVLSPTNALPPPMLELGGRQDQVELISAYEDLIAGRRDTAITKLESILKRSPGLAKAWETLGWAYWQVGRELDAIALWQRWMEVDPQIPLPYNLLAQACVAHKELGRAVELYQQSLKLDPQQFDAQFGLARIFRWTGDADRSIDIFRNLLQRDPGRTDVKVELGRALLEMDRFEEAAPIWAEMIQMSPTNQVFMERQALSLLHTGKVKESQELMEKLLAQNPNNLFVRDMQADLALSSDHPEEALAPLRALMQHSQEPKQRLQARMRLIRLLIRLNRQDALRYSLNEAKTLVREMVKEDPDNADAQLMLGEILLMESRPEAATRQFQYVLQYYNPDNQRARRGLFETYLGMRQYKEALEQFKYMEAFNPRDPYLQMFRVRLEECRGDYPAVNRAIRVMEQAGSRGAVAVLVYHGLTTSEWQDTISVSRFREHMEVLKKAGFIFLTPDEIPAYFAKWNKAEGAASGPPERAVCVTFDDARRDGMRLATAVGQQLGIRFGMFVPVVNIERADPFMVTWDMLRQYQQTGIWVVGSHLYASHDMELVSSEKQKGCPLFNRLWLEREKRMESESEFMARLTYEYRHSREVLEKQLGRKVDFMSYPIGNIGQETAGNVSNAIPINLKMAANNYSTCFVQTQHGFAINGDNPLLYQRYEVERDVNGNDLLLRIMENHPYFVGLSYRVKVAALEGRVYHAKALLKDLQQAGYPEPLFKQVEGYVHAKLAGEFYQEGKLGGVRKNPFELDLGAPYVGVRGEYFQDNLDARAWRILGLGGLRVTPSVVLEGRAGVGEMRQSMTGTNTASPMIKLSEKVAGLYPVVTLPNGWTVDGEFAVRMFSGDVPTNLNGQTRSFDKMFLQYAVGAGGKIFAPLEVALRFEHDIIPSARQVAAENTYNLFAGSAAFDLTDWWQLNAAGQVYSFSDGNSRQHLTLISDWTVWDLTGLHGGVGYAYANAADASSDYWTPYKQNRFFLEGGMRGSYLRSFYNLGAQLGIGQQGIRPEKQAAFDAEVARAQRERWSQQAMDELLATAPSSDWTVVLQLKGSVRVKLSDTWDLNGEVAYNRVPDYNEITINGGLKYRF